MAGARRRHKLPYHQAPFLSKKKEMCVCCCCVFFYRRTKVKNEIRNNKVIF